MSTNPPLTAEMQATLINLFDLFSQYVASSGSRQKHMIHSQIIGLFNKLGVVADNPAVKRAAETFARIRPIEGNLIPVEVSLPNVAKAFVNTRVKTYEQRSGIHLTSSAKQFLRIPVIEAVKLTHGFDQEQIETSVDRVLANLAEAPVSVTEGHDNTRTSVAVIRSFWQNFCNIPPFCRGRER